MCGRYSLAPEQCAEIAEIVRQVQDRVKTGEIFPTNAVPVLVKAGQALTPDMMAWGFPRFQGKSGCIINARSETALERPMFRKSLLERRCIVPTTGFFEWGPDGHGKKKKYQFNLPGEATALYLAGLWSDFSGERRCVILTASANRSVSDIHDRMPVILEKNRLETWAAQTEMALELLHEPQPMLQREPVEEARTQFSLF